MLWFSDDPVSLTHLTRVEGAKASVGLIFQYLPVNLNRKAMDERSMANQTDEPVHLEALSFVDYNFMRNRNSFLKGCRDTAITFI